MTIRDFYPWEVWTPFTFSPQPNPLIQYQSSIVKCDGTLEDKKDGTVFSEPSDLPSIQPPDPNWLQKKAALLKEWANEKGKQVHEAVKNYTTLRVKKLTPTAILPTKAYSTDMGIDLYVDSIELEGQSYDSLNLKNLFGKPFKIHTGIALGFPTNYGGKIEDRSSLGSKGLRTLGGVIDNGYTSEIIICAVWLNAFDDLQIKNGDKVAQLVLAPYTNYPIMEVEDLGETDRGTNGFGSSGG